MKYLASILLLAAMLAASVQADVRNRSGIRVILKMNSQAETAGTAANAAGIPQSRILGTIPKDNLVIAKLTWRQIYSAMSNPNVRQAYYDWPMSLGKTLKTRQVGGKDAGSWGLDRIDQRASELDGRYNMTTTGEGVNAYIIDTGLRTSHSEFEGRASHAFSAYGDGSDGNGHGTHVAGTIGGKNYGVAPGAKLHGVKVLSDDGWGYISDIVDGINYVAKNAIKPAVANLSLGGSPHDLLDNAVRDLIQAGVTVAVAAGNENDDASSSSPARVEEALTIGSSEMGDRMSYFSNYGELLDVFAPGSDVVSATADNDNSIASWSGTSMAAPHVAGVAALFLENLFNEAGEDHKPEEPEEPQPEDPEVPNPDDPETPNPENPLPEEPEEPELEPIVDTYKGIMKQWRFKKIARYKSGPGVHEGVFTGPENTDFDLYLLQRERRSWKILASSFEEGSDEYIAYDLTKKKGKYLWLGVSFLGKGRYELTVSKYEPMPDEFEW